MKKYPYPGFLLLSLTWLSLCQAQNDHVAYFGQKPPGSRAEIFAPGVVSIAGRFERVITFSPDGMEMFFNVTTAKWTPTKIWHSKYENGKWHEPDVAWFSSSTMDAEPFLSPGGNRLYFTSNRLPASGWNYDFWMIEKQQGAWSEPTRLSEAVNTDNGEWHPCVSANRNLYFARYPDGDIFVARFADGEYQTAVKVAGVNSEAQDWDPYVSPDESYMVFKSDRPGGYGGTDLYVSFKGEANRWSTPINMGASINTEDSEDPGDVTVDGQYLFFARIMKDTEMDIYWVSADIIDELRPALSSGAR